MRKGKKDLMLLGGHYEFYDIRCEVLSVRECILRLALRTWR